MRIFISCKLLILTLLLAGLLVAPISAQDTAYRRVVLAHDISIEIPLHWKVLSQETRKNIGATAETMLKNADLDGPSGKKNRLLAVNATPAPTGAMIRVNAISPPDYTQANLADLEVATPADLKYIGTEMQNMFKKLEASGGPKIIEMQPIRIERLNNYRVLVISYVRAGLNEPSPWQVTQYKIPVSERLIEITLSHRKSDAVLWRPILERVKRSVHF